MFEFDKTNKILSKLVTIMKDFTILHFDDIPILITGYTEKGKRVIKSIIYNDTEKNASYYFCTFISEKIFNLFLKKKITYRDIILKYKYIFIVKYESQNDNTSLKTDTYKIKTKDIPADWLPTEDSFYEEE